MLTATLSTRQAGQLVVAFVSAQGRGQSISRPSTKGLKWGLVARRASGSGAISIWQATAARPLRKAVVSTRLASPSSQALLSVIAFAPGTRVGAGASANGRDGAPLLKLRSPGGATIWSVGEDASSGASRQALPGSRIIKQIHSAQPGEAVWLQNQAVAKAAQVKVGDKRPSSKSWLLASVVIRGTGALASARRANATGAVASAPRASATGAAGGQEPAGEGFGYNANGDRTSITTASGIVQLRYDQANRLIGYGGDVTYGYDGDGLRMNKTVHGTVTQFTWDESGSIPLLLQGGSTYYVSGPNGQPIEQISGGTPTYLLADQAGSTRLLTDGGGNVIGTYT
jgi:hypothetical protein